MKNFFWNNFFNGLHLPLNPISASSMQRLKGTPYLDFTTYNQNRSKEDRKYFCQAPFKSLYFGHGGMVSPCCFNRRYLLGDITKQNIDSIWQGPPLKIFRNALIKNDLSLGCYICEQQLRNKNYNAISALMYDGLPSGNKWPQMLEFETDNTCNLECVMCSGEYSSAIRKNRENKSVADNVYDDSFLLHLQPYLKTLKDAKFNGGEPFLSPLYQKIWAEIIRVNPSCRISVQTNATILNDTVKDFLNKGNFHISVSLDALDKDLYEKIRVNASYEKVLNNISYFRDYCLEKSHYFGIAVCPMRLNWKEIPVLMNFAIKNKAHIYFHTVWFPPSLALWNLSFAELKNIYQYLDRFNWAPINEIEKNNIKAYRRLIVQVEQWCQAAKRREAEISYVNGSEELKIELNEKINTWCDANIANIDEKQVKKVKFKTIIEEVIDGIENEALTKCLIEILKTPVEFIILTLETDDRERIGERFKAYIF